jgi:ubiquinone/menaquinone biosynthesis C-methylase UbiE
MNWINHMEEREFDKFADEYHSVHARNIRYSGESPKFFAEYKIKDLAQVIGHELPLNILDFGGGIGTSVPYFRKYFPTSPLTCLDVSHKSLRLAEESFPDMADFVHFDGMTIPFEDNSFDIVFAACVFHHIDHAAHVGLLYEIKRVLKQSGIVFIFEHNPLNPLTVYAVNTCEFDENAHLILGRQMQRRLRRAGFGNIDICYRIFFSWITCRTALAREIFSMDTFGSSILCFWS